MTDHPTRLVTIHSQGRDVAVNRTLYFESEGPLEFRSVERIRTHSSKDRSYSEVLGRTPGPQETAILHELLLQPMNAYQLAHDLGYPANSIRNALAVLVKANAVYVCSEQGRTREFTLTDKMRAELETRNPKPDRHEQHEPHEQPE